MAVSPIIPPRCGRRQRKKRLTVAAQAVLHARMAARANGHVGDKGCERQGRKEGSGERLSTGGKEREERKCPRGGLWPAEAKRKGRNWI